MFASKDTLLTRPSGGYTIARSVRLRSSASAYFNRTPAGAGNQKTWTMSFWLKRGSLSQSRSGVYSTTGVVDYIEFGGGYGQYDFEVTFNNASGARIATNALYRDPAAWYHFVIATDTTQSTASNRILLYVNGVQITSFVSASYPSQNYNTAINSAVAQYIGADYNLTSGQYFDGYMTEFNFIDGQQLTPSSFGTTNAITGVWQPAKYTGTYGTNGFYLNFSDNSNNTATTIGKDYSGNGNNWTPNNISVTAGVTYDSMTDVPTLTSATAANYAVLNPLDISGGTVSNGNLTYVGSNFVRGTITPTSGKYYWEVTVDSVGGGNCDIGLFKQSVVFSATTNRIEYRNDGNKVSDASVVAYGATYTTNDIIGVAADFDNGTITFYKNNSSQGTITYGSIVGYSPHSYCGTSFGHSYTFGQRPFSYTPPTGYVALNTYNLPAGTITTSGSFTGNVSTDGPFVYLNGVPTAMTINGNAVTFGTNADNLANGFKVRSSSSSYNASGSNTYSITTTGDKFKNANAQTNP